MSPDTLSTVIVPVALVTSFRRPIVVRPRIVTSPFACSTGGVNTEPLRAVSVALPASTAIRAPDGVRSTSRFQLFTSTSPSSLSSTPNSVTCSATSIVMSVPA